MTTEDKLRLVCEYMGYKVYNKRYPKNHGIGGFIDPPPKEIILQRAKYHISFDWLNEVCRKVVCELRKSSEQRAYAAEYHINVASQYPYDIPALFEATVSAIIFIQSINNEI